MYGVSHQGELITVKMATGEQLWESLMATTGERNSSFNREVVWTHPAFARRCIFARNDKEIVCASLAAEQK